MVREGRRERKSEERDSNGERERDGERGRRNRGREQIREEQERKHLKSLSFHKERNMYLKELKKSKGL